jgi:hypothetical protein
MSVGGSRQKKSEVRGREVSKDMRRRRQTPTARQQNQSAATRGKSPLVTRETHAGVLTVRVSMDLRRRGGRKLVVVPGLSRAE